MQLPEFPIAVIIERRPLANRWQTQTWEAIGVIPDPGDAAAPRVLLQDDTRMQWLYGGFVVELHRDEAENYYLNLSAKQPCVFIVWRMDDDLAVPKFVTVSYGEAARFMDADEKVDTVPMARDMCDWLGEFVNRHYKPEPKKRSRPPSFKGAKRG
ncbi:MAG: DUF3305 domain-containing protein [Betaproteobacteria bacterium]|nr:MAG: DUF3305 domain-containing protein [Betaproteobacteria bacterium]